VICDDGAVSRSVRQLLIALLLACSGVVLVQLPAHACRCDVPRVGQAAKQADVVFSGALRGERRGTRQATLALDVDRVYKGRVDESPVEVATPTDSCGLRLVRGQSYVVFAVERGARLTSEQCYGTGRARGRTLDSVQQALGPGRAFEQPVPEPEPPTYTRVLDSDPPRFTRLAAPGAGLVLVGLLGWLLLRGRD